MTDRPVSVAGGCLCGALRYHISFPPGAEWPPSANPTCQCTRCRKFTGALVPQLIAVPKANIQPSLVSQESYKAYSVPDSPRGRRIFCAECGSSIAYENDDDEDFIEIYAGSLDEEVLCGKKEGGKRAGGVGWSLCHSTAHIWMENAVPGLTDGFAGELWTGDRGSSRYGGDGMSKG